ncbi:hypothetical protein L9F63_012713, partial [Diploptera punctata]
YIFTQKSIVVKNKHLPDQENTWYYTGFESGTVSSQALRVYYQRFRMPCIQKTHHFFQHLNRSNHAYSLKKTESTSSEDGLNAIISIRPKDVCKGFVLSATTSTE